MIYLSSPLWHPQEQVMNKRVKLIQEVMVALIMRGTFAFSPIAHNYPAAKSQKVILDDEMNNKEIWMPFDLEMLHLCSEMWVVQIDGWDESNGITIEISEASIHGIPVSYHNPKMLILGKY